MVYIAELSPDNRRSVLGSGLEIGTLAGYILASLLASGMFIALSDAQMLAWGWRIPFILGAPLGLIGLYLRRHLDETPIFENEIEENEEEPESFVSIIKNHKKILSYALLQWHSLISRTTCYFHTCHHI